jgi:hypothetical protein
MNTKATSAAEELVKNGVNPAKIMNSSLMEGINYTFFISTFIAAIALLLTFFIKKPTRPVSEEEKNEVYKQVPVEDN